MKLTLFQNIDLILDEFDILLAGENLCRFSGVSESTMHRRTTWNQQIMAAMSACLFSPPESKEIP